MIYYRIERRCNCWIYLWWCSWMIYYRIESRDKPQWDRINAKKRWWSTIELKESSNCSSYATVFSQSWWSTIELKGSCAYPTAPSPYPSRMIYYRIESRRIVYADLCFFALGWSTIELKAGIIVLEITWDLSMIYYRIERLQDTWINTIDSNILDDLL